MITLKDIINFIENNNLKIYGQYENIVIDNITIFKDCKEYLKSTLYLTDDIKLTFPKGYIVLAITKNIDKNSSLLQLNSHITLEKLYIIISKFLMDKQRLYIKKYNIFNSINNDYDINEILNIAEDYINNPVFLLDTSYKILGLSKLASLTTDSIESYNEHYYLVSEVIEAIKRDSCMNLIYNNEAFFHFTKEKFIFC